MVVLDKRPFSLENTAICIGKFDGLHTGHQILLNSICSYPDLQHVLFTFRFPESESIYSEEEKRKLAESMGIDVYISCPFDMELSHMTPLEFIQDILVNQCGAKVISVGKDFHFGYQRKGDVETLKEYSDQFQYELHVFEKKELSGEVISSTRIRNAIKEGKIQLVNTLLGRPYSISGEVVRGNQIGRTLGMPTVNQSFQENKMIPKYGVYASRVCVDGRIYSGVTNVGVKPTIPGQYRAGAETYILDFNSDIYGKIITVELYDFLRPEKKFSDLEMLKKQMEQDQMNARQTMKCFV